MKSSAEAIINEEAIMKAKRRERNEEKMAYQ